ncbi:MAG: secretin N-terminal domain-containing protein [bacterium]
MQKYLSLNRQHSILRTLYISAVLFLTLSANVYAGRLEKVNVQEDAGTVYVKLTGTERFRYRMKEYESPPHVVIQLYNTKSALAYDAVPVSKGNVTNVTINELTMNDDTSTYVSVHLKKSSPVDFKVSPDGRTFTFMALPVSEAAAAGKKDKWAPPPIYLPGEPGAAQKTASEGKYPEFPDEQDKSPFIAGPLVLTDADISEAIKLISEAFGGVNIVVDGSIIAKQEQAKAQGAAGGGGGGTIGAEAVGITVTLRNITLEDALDAITSANKWMWQKVGNIYIIMDDKTDEYGYSLVETGRYFDPAQQMDVDIYRPKYIYACQLVQYGLNIVPSATCDSYANVAIFRGAKKDLDRLRKIVSDIDRPDVSQPTNFITRIIKLKYIRANDLAGKLTTLLGNPYLGNLNIIGGAYSGNATTSQNTDNTLSVDEATNTLIFVGRQDIYDRIMPIINQLDEPFSATAIRTIPLKYVQVTDLQNDQDFMQNLVSLLGRGGTGGTSGSSSQFFYSNDTNSLTFVGTDDDYDRLIQVINVVDVESRQFITEAVALENIRVEDVKAMEATILTPVLSMQEFGGSGTTGGGPSGRVSMSYNPVSNTVIIAGPRQYVDRIKMLIKSMDTEPSDITTKEFPLKYMRADRALEIVKNIIYKGIPETLKEAKDGSFFNYQELQSVGGEEGGSAGLTTKETQNLTVDFVEYQSKEDDKTGFKDVNKLVLHAEFTRNSIIASGTKYDLKRVEEIIKLIDKSYPQIMIKLQVLELWHEKGKEIGIGYVYQDKHFTTNFNFEEFPHNREEPEGETPYGGFFPDVSSHYYEVYDQQGKIIGLADPYHQVTGDSGFFLYDTAENFLTEFAPSLKALITSDVGRLIAEPSITVAENMSAIFDFTDKIPYVQTTTTISGGVAQTQQTVEKEDIGFKLTVLPHFTEDGFIVLKITDMQIRLLKGYILVGGTNNVPAVSTRSIVTEAKLKNEQPFIIGGIKNTSHDKTQSRVPLLSDIPLIGKLFKETSVTEKESEIVLIITPIIIPSS